MLHAVGDADGKPLILLLTEGRVSDCRGIATVPPLLPDADTPIGDKGHDGDRFLGALAGRGIAPSIPWPRQPQETRRVRHRTLQAVDPHRTHVREAQGPAPHRHV